MAHNDSESDSGFCGRKGMVTKVQCKVCAMSISGYSLRMMLITPDV